MSEPSLPGTEPGVAESEARLSGALHLVLIGVVALAVVGYFVGLGNRDVGDRDVGSEQADSEQAGNEQTTATSGGHAGSEVPPASSYDDLREKPIRANVKFHSDLSTLMQPTVDLFAEFIVTDAEKAAALARRAARRAFNGAPPPVPHAIDAISSAACLHCHRDGLAVGELLAPPIPHRAFASCTQCHVPSIGHLPSLASAPDGGVPFAENTWVGLSAPFAGARASPGAPPTIPHSTQLRDNCLACHGPLAQKGLRTTHPWRKSCLQCHAPSAQLNRIQLGTHGALIENP